jgi:7-cyano-7-deazaguanine synthase
MRLAIQHGTYLGVKLETPFVNLTKAQIVELGMDLSVPFERTYSCYKGKPTHCGKCGTCYERREAFKLAGFTDPTEYKK